jgi:hypothetical protein
VTNRPVRTSRTTIACYVSDVREQVISHRSPFVGDAITCAIDTIYIPLGPGRRTAGPGEAPQPWTADANAHMKGAVEDFLHREVCRGTMPLAEAQRQIATDWLSVYRGRSLQPAPELTGLLVRPRSGDLGRSDLRRAVVSLSCPFGTTDAAPSINIGGSPQRQKGRPRLDLVAIGADPHVGRKLLL